jgi:predicted secreted protein
MGPPVRRASRKEADIFIEVRPVNFFAAPDERHLDRSASDPFFNRGYQSTGTEIVRSTVSVASATATLIASGKVLANTMKAAAEDGIAA